jgi:ATP-binding cassette subfamily B protein
VLKNISLTIKRNSITAIVGQSGCGKTTLLKLLLKFYEADEGKITVGDTAFNTIPHNDWRGKCGTVLQDAYIFSETIAENITLAADTPDEEKLKQALTIANLTTLVEDLPLGINTRIGSNGMQLSGGEKQRVLIARAVYNNPAFVFFDEATSALDAVNERQIVNNLGRFFENKTVVIIAHRLSTVQHADQIIVMDKGEVVEIGTHQQLVGMKGFYHTLVKNQLELNG